MKEINKNQLSQENSLQNSLVNNSISFGNSSEESEEINDLECFSLDFKIDKGGNNHHFPCTFGSKSTTVSL